MAYFTPTTVFAALITLLSLVSVILALLGGLQSVAIRDLPWLAGQLTLSFPNGAPLSNSSSVNQKLSVIVSHYTIGLWNFCESDSIANDVKCQSLADAVDSGVTISVDSFGLSTSIANSGNANVPQAYIKALPYLHVAAAAVIASTIVAFLLVSTASAALFSWIALVVQAVAFGISFYVMTQLKTHVNDAISNDPILRYVSNKSLDWGVSLWLSMGALCGILAASVIFSCGICAERKRWKRYTYDY